MLQPCANPECSVHFAVGASKCPACGTPVAQRVSGASLAAPSPAGPDSDMTVAERRGKEILTIFIGLILLEEIGVTLLTFRMGATNLTVRGVRMSVTLFLCSALYCGSTLAKRISIVLYSIGSVFGLVQIVIRRDLVTTVLMLGIISLFVAFIVVLQKSSSVDAYVAYQRRKRGGLDVTHASPDLAPAEPHACPMCGATIDAHAFHCSACGEHVAGRRF